MLWRQLSIVGSNVTCKAFRNRSLEFSQNTTWIRCLTSMNKVCRISNHWSINPQPLVMASSSWARLRLDAARKQLNHDITRSGHFLVAGIFNYRRNFDGFFSWRSAKFDWEEEMNELVHAKTMSMRWCGKAKISLNRC